MAKLWIATLCLVLTAALTAAAPKHQGLGWWNYGMKQMQTRETGDAAPSCRVENVVAGHRDGKPRYADECTSHGCYEADGACQFDEDLTTCKCVFGEETHAHLEPILDWPTI